MPAAIAVPAIIGAAGIGTGIATSVMGANAARDASNAQVQSANYAADLQKQSSDQALQFQKDVWAQQQKNQQPWLEAGQGALTQLSDLLKPGGELQQGFDPNSVDVTKDPGYQFRLDQGQKALERSAAARGATGSGGTLKAITRYGQDYASNEYKDAYSRAFNTFNSNQANRFNRLASLAGVGQTATAQLGSEGTAAAGGVASNLINTGANLGNIAQAAGNARASGYVGSANAINSGLGSAMNGIQNMYALSQLFKSQPQAPLPYENPDISFATGSIPGLIH